MLSNFSYDMMLSVTWAYMLEETEKLQLLLVETPFRCNMVFVSSYKLQHHKMVSAKGLSPII